MGRERCLVCRCQFKSAEVKGFSSREKVKVADLCWVLCDPRDCSLPGSSVHGFLQARILEWVAISFSKRSPTQGMNLGLLHCRQILYRLTHQGSPFQFTPLPNWAKDESLWTKSSCPALSLFPLQSHYLKAWCPLLSFFPLSWIIN